MGPGGEALGGIAPQDDGSWGLHELSNLAAISRVCGGGTASAASGTGQPHERVGLAGNVRGGRHCKLHRVCSHPRPESACAALRIPLFRLSKSQQCEFPLKPKLSSMASLSILPLKTETNL